MRYERGAFTRCHLRHPPHTRTCRPISRQTARFSSTASCGAAGRRDRPIDHDAGVRPERIQHGGLRNGRPGVLYIEPPPPRHRDPLGSSPKHRKTSSLLASLVSNWLLRDLSPQPPIGLITVPTSAPAIEGSSRNRERISERARPARYRGHCGLRRHDPSTEITEPRLRAEGARVRDVCRSRRRRSHRRISKRSRLRILDLRGRAHATSHGSRDESGARRLRDSTHAPLIARDSPWQPRFRLGGTSDCPTAASTHSRAAPCSRPTR